MAVSLVSIMTSSPSLVPSSSDTRVLAIESASISIHGPSLLVTSAVSIRPTRARFEPWLHEDACSIAAAVWIVLIVLLVFIGGGGIEGIDRTGIVEVMVQGRTGEPELDEMEDVMEE